MGRIVLIIKEDFKDPKGKIIKKNISLRTDLNVDAIIDFNEVYNSKGNIIKNKCAVILADNRTLIVSHSFDYIQKLTSKMKVKGFNYKNKH